MSRLAFVFAVVVSLAGSARAHDLWLEREGAEVGPRSLYALYYGHRHSDHEGADLVEYDPSWVQRAVCLDVAGQPLRFEPIPGYPYRIRGDCALARVLISSGYWTRTPYGTRNVPRSEARMPVESWLSYESAQWIGRWSDELARPLAAGLELTPLADPLRTRRGQKLRLRVTLDGRPVEGATVSYDGKPRGRTGRDGEINVRLRHGDFQLIQASWRSPDSSGRADEIVHTANLVFVLKEPR